MDTFKTVDIRNPNTFVFIIGATGTSSQIPDNEKWVEVPLSTDQTLLFVKEFQNGYSAASIEPPMEYWLKHGLVFVTVGEAKIVGMDEVVAEHGEKAVEDILWRCMGNYRHPRWIVENSHRLFEGMKFVTPAKMWEGTPYNNDIDALEQCLPKADSTSPYYVTPEDIGVGPAGDIIEGECERILDLNNLGTI